MFLHKKTNKTFKGVINYCPYSRGVWVVDTLTLETYSFGEVEVII